MTDGQALWNLTCCSSVYLALQLARCACFSFVWALAIMLLRRTLFKKLIFAKGMLWASFLLLPCLGKLKLFYENTLCRKVTWRLTDGMMAHPWIAHVYLAGVFLSVLYLIWKRIGLKRSVSRMKTRFLCGTKIYLTDMRVTPFTVGLFRGKIVLPEIMADSYGEDELQMVIRHEQTHVRLGHLQYYFLWDAICCLFWIDPLLPFCKRYMRTDLEDMCDRVCIQNSGNAAQEYGRLLLKSLKLLRREQGGVSSVVAYAGEKDFQEMKKRMQKIAGFRTYRKSLCLGIVFVCAACFAVILIGIKNNSYSRCNESDAVWAYAYHPESGETVILEDDGLRKMISYDDDYLYVDRIAFEAFLQEREAAGEVYIVFGGFYKFPGIGGSGNVCRYRGGTNEKIVRLPYEKQKDSFSMALFKLL